MEVPRCPSCRTELPGVPGLRFCPQCGAMLPTTLGIPMEQRHIYGFFNALWQTWRQACLEPMAFFRQVGLSQDVGSAVLFLLLISLVSGLGSGLVALVGLQAPLWALLGREKMPTLPSLGGTLGVFLLSLPSMILLTLIGWAIGAAILHLMLFIVGGARRGMTTTALVMAYANAPQIFNVVPWLGGVVASIWGLVLLIIGLAQAHETDTWRVVLAVFLPLLLCCGAILVVSTLLFATHRPGA